MSNLYFPLAGFFCALLIIIAFYSKKRVNSKETKIYSYMVISGLLDSIIVIVTILLGYINYNNIHAFFVWILNKIDFIHYIMWPFLSFLYVFYITYSNDKRKMQIYDKIKKIFLRLNLLIVFLEFILPLDLYNKDGVMGISGLSVNIVYTISLVYILAIGFIIVKNYKKVFTKKYIPMFALFVFLVFVAIIRVVNPTLLIISPVLVYVNLIMFFTIENPDVKMLNEVYKNKELMEQTYEDKYNFLFEMTQEARNPLININRVYNEIKDENDPKIIKEGLSAINNLTRQLDFSINNILNISSFDVQKIKVIENKYDLGNFCNNLSTVIKTEIKNNVVYKEEIPKQLPILYGDSLKLRQILYSLLNNSCKYTEEGTIIFKVNVIEKYDICRVIFNIIDTGHGIPIEEINDILSSTGELSQSEIEALDKKDFNIKLCQKVIKIMGGNLMIKSNEQSGTEIILTIDQRVYHENEDSIINKYANQIANYQRVLIVAQTKELASKIKKKLKDNNIMYSHFLNGYDAIDKVKSGKEYDLILIEDEMREINGFVTMQELNKIKNFKIPCIVMLKPEKENIKKHYIEDGFKDAINISKIELELDKIIKNDL